MISKETIIKTSICYWSDDDGCFVVESPLVDITAGVGETVELAKRHYAEMLDDVYPELLKDNVIGYKGGRPAKGGVQMNTLVQPATKKQVSELSEKIGISQGEVIDFLVGFYSRRNTDPSPPKRQITIELPATEITEKQAADVAADILKSVRKHFTVPERVTDRVRKTVEKSRGGNKVPVTVTAYKRNRPTSNTAKKAPAKGRKKRA